MIDLLKKLMFTPGISGREDKIRDVIKKEIEPYADEISVDNVGNLIARKKGNGKKIMLCAHMDEIGFMVTNIEESGMIRVAPIGGINPVASCYNEVKFQNGTVGLLVVEDGTKLSDVENNKLFVDVGADNASKAKRKIKPSQIR